MAALYLTQSADIAECSSEEVSAYFKKALASMGKIVVVSPGESMPLSYELFGGTKLLQSTQVAAQLRDNPQDPHNGVVYRLKVDEQSADESNSTGSTENVQVLKNVPVRIKRCSSSNDKGTDRPLQWVEVYAPIHKLFGVVVQESKHPLNKFTVRSASNDVLLRVEQQFPNEGIHQVLTADNEQVGSINRAAYKDINGRVLFEAFCANLTGVEGDMKVHLFAAATLITCLYVDGYYCNENKEQPLEHTSKVLSEDLEKNMGEDLANEEQQKG